MAGKHSAGDKARKHTSIGKILLIALIVVVVGIAVTAGALWLFAAEPMPEEISGEEAIQAAGDAPDEIKAPEAEAMDEPVPAAEEPVAEDPFDEMKAPEEEPVDEEFGSGPEVPGEEIMESPPEADFAQIFDEAGVEPTYQLAAEAGGFGYSVMARGNPMTGISLYEFLYDGEDRVVTMAETYYSFFQGATPEDMEQIAAQLLAESQPPEELDYVTVTGEIVDTCVVLRIRMEGMDDPTVVEKLSEIAFIPYTPDEYLYFTATHERLVDSMGYAER